MVQKSNLVTNLLSGNRKVTLLRFCFRRVKLYAQTKKQFAKAG